MQNRKARNLPAKSIAQTIPICALHTPKYSKNYETSHCPFARAINNTSKSQAQDANYVSSSNVQQQEPTTGERVHNTIF